MPASETQLVIKHVDWRRYVGGRKCYGFLEKNALESKEMSNISTQINHAKCYHAVKRNVTITPAMERSGVTYGLKRVRVEVIVTVWVG